MKKISLLFILLSILISCKNKTKDNQKPNPIKETGDVENKSCSRKPLTLSDSAKKVNMGNIPISKEKLSPSIIIGKTFYYTSRDENGKDVVQDIYGEGLTGIRFSKDSMVSFGIDYGSVGIDSIVSYCNHLKIYTSDKFFDSDEGKYVNNYYVYSAFKAKNKVNFINLAGDEIIDCNLDIPDNKATLLVDSVYAKDLIVKFNPWLVQP
ncbi:hypothetical protein OAT16_07810 [Prolixibacteraceae bacterium]|nr:hypothetical protein [Prolixibacteraceae bacterium]